MSDLSEYIITDSDKAILTKAYYDRYAQWERNNTTQTSDPHNLICYFAISDLEHSTHLVLKPGECHQIYLFLDKEVHHVKEHTFVITEGCVPE